MGRFIVIFTYLYQHCAYLHNIFTPIKYTLTSITLTDIIKTFVESQGWAFKRIDGRTPSKNRFDISQCN